MFEIHTYNRFWEGGDVNAENNCCLSSFYKTIWLYRNSLIVFTQAHIPPQPPPPISPDPKTTTISPLTTINLLPNSNPFPLFPRLGFI
jgi:hypothetical protein